VISEGPTPLNWRKSSHSTGQGGDRVELAVHRGRLLIRDSKHPELSALTLTGSSAESLFQKIHTTG